MKTSTRRSFLGATVALPIAAHATAPQTSPTVAHPDAELIAVCAEFDAYERQTAIIHGSGPDRVVDDDDANAASAPLFKRMSALIDRMGELRATTPAGIQARAHSLAQHSGHGDYDFGCRDSMAGRLLVYLMRDAAVLGGSPASIVKPTPSPDAELLDLCAEFDRLEQAYIDRGGNYKPGSLEDEAAEADRDRLSAAQDPLVERICELRAVTRGGHVARARSLALWDAELLKDGPGDTGACLTTALVRDLLAGSAEV